MASLMSAKVLKLLSGTSDEEVLAGLTILVKMKTDRPTPSSVAKALNPSFLTRLITTANNSDDQTETSHHSYYALSFHVWSYILSSQDSSTASSFSTPLTQPVFTLFKKTSPALPPAVNLSIATAVSNLTQTEALLNLPSPNPAVSSAILGLIARVETSKKQAKSLPEWEQTNLPQVLAACDDFITQCLLSRPSTLTTPSISLFVSNSSNLTVSLSALRTLFLLTPPKTQSAALFSFDKSATFQKSVRRVLTTCLKEDSATNKEDPSRPSSSSLRSQSLYLVGMLLEKSGGKWVLDGPNENKPLQAMVRIACGELRVCLSSTLEIAETDESDSANVTFLHDLSTQASICIQIFLLATKLLCELIDDMEDEEGGGRPTGRPCPLTI
ncbi:hypothetical protein TL16_g10443 [Triparma laevis f. inornata]|uniref:Uncharacterized protein n=1 Tax=Triparma laevis f. inornata TaxID=1714386 RepID=A0A9W7BEB8_9STRA|nr:hypothetical protein TL16_g10443 [Triparma laevis f. inornata]